MELILLCTMLFAIILIAITFPIIVTAIFIILFLCILSASIQTAYDDLDETSKMIVDSKYDNNVNVIGKYLTIHMKDDNGNMKQINISNTPDNLKYVKMIHDHKYSFTPKHIKKQNIHDGKVYLYYYDSDDEDVINELKFVSALQNYQSDSTS